MFKAPKIGKLLEIVHWFPDELNSLGSLLRYLPIRFGDFFLSDEGAEIHDVGGFKQKKRVFVTSVFELPPIK